MPVKTIIGDCRAVLRDLPEKSVNCIITSPPYFQQRSYLPDGAPTKALEIGLEATPRDYIASLVSVFEECRRVLTDDGSLWINIGDSYAVSGRGGNPATSVHQKQKTNVGSVAAAPINMRGLKPKDIIGVPYMLAFAMRDEAGWYWRGDHHWGKPNGMPESVTDRPTLAHESVMLFTKSARYWYDKRAVETAPKASSITRLKQNIEAQQEWDAAYGGTRVMKAMGLRSSTLEGGPSGRHGIPEALPENQRRSDKQRGHSRRHAGFNDRWDVMSKEEQQANGAQLRSIWWVPTAGYKGSHYAVMPELVAEICIRASCPHGGTVLDPFGGTGTVGDVAQRLGRSAILIDLDELNENLIKERCEQPFSVSMFDAMTD